MARRTLRLALALGLCSCSGAAAGGRSELPSCPRPSQAVSGRGNTKVKVVFSTEEDATFDVLWVSPEGDAVTLDPFHRKGSVESFAGHVFRVVPRDLVDSRGEPILVREYTTTEERLQEVSVDSCREYDVAKRAANLGAAVREPSARRAEFEALVHELVEGDAFAPCGPDGKSEQWSCVRKIPKEVCEDRHRNLAATDGSEFGFKKARGKWKVGSFEDRQFDWQQERIPKLSDGPGFLKMNMTKRLRETLLPWYHERAAKNQFDVETPVEGGYMNDNEVRNDLISLDTDVPTRTKVVEEMRQVLEWWSKGVALAHHSTFGVRVYRRHATLLNHVDRMDTHLASAILQVHQKVDKDGGWPVEVLSLDRDCYEVYLQPGEMLLYEGARYAHGRPMRFRGETFANVFSHFAPKSWTGLSRRKQEL